MMLLASVIHLRLSLCTPAISMWPKTAQGAAKRNVPTRRRASIFGSLAEDQHFWWLKKVVFHLMFFFENARNSFQPSGWIEQVQQLVDKLQMIRRLWTGSIIFNPGLEQLDDCRGWTLGATAQVLWSSSITWSGCSRCTDGWDWAIFGYFGLTLQFVSTILTRSPMSCVQCCIGSKNKPWLSPSIAGHQNNRAEGLGPHVWSHCGSKFVRDIWRLGTIHFQWLPFSFSILKSKGCTLKYIHTDKKIWTT